MILYLTVLIAVAGFTTVGNTGRELCAMASINQAEIAGSAYLDFKSVGML